jgi:EcsC family protein
MSNEDQNAIAKAVSEVLSFTYDRVAVNKESILREAAERGKEFPDWDAYQRKAPFMLMDELADAHIQRCKVTVSGLSAAAGFGGLVAAIPDALQFVTLTLRMVTGIAAAYGFDPDADANHGKNKLIILQAYLNANLGQSAAKSAEAVGLSAVTKLVRDVATRSQWLTRLLILIGRIIGIRLSKQGILRSIPVVSSGINAGFSWYLVRDIAKSARAELKQFRDDLRLGKHHDDPDFSGLGN